MPVDGDAASSHLSPVADRRAVDVSILPPEKILNSGSWDCVTVDRFILEENNVTNLRDQSLFLPGHSESPSGVFLLPEWVVEIKDDSPPGKLVLNREVRVDLVYEALPEPEEDVVGGEGDSQGSTQD